MRGLEGVVRLRGRVCGVSRHVRGLEVKADKPRLLKAVSRHVRGLEVMCMFNKQAQIVSRHVRCLEGTSNRLTATPVMAGADMNHRFTLCAVSGSCWRRCLVER